MKIKFLYRIQTCACAKSEKILKGPSFFLSYNLSDDFYLVFGETMLGIMGFSEEQTASFK